MQNRKRITIVSGLPRSGTSLLMQMLRAGGIPVLTDNFRAPDEDNPHGYLELEKVKAIKHDATWLADAEGKAVKAVHVLLYDFPKGRDYNVIFARRNMREVIASQRKLLERQNKPLAPIPDEQLARVFEEQVNKVLSWMAEEENFRVLEVRYQALMEQPQDQALRICQFLGENLNIEAMASAVDPALYRNRLAK